MQGAEKISQRRICLIYKQEIFLQRSSWDEIWIFRGAHYTSIKYLGLLPDNLTSSAKITALSKAHPGLLAC